VGGGSRRGNTSRHCGQHRAHTSRDAAAHHLGGGAHDGGSRGSFQKVSLREDEHLASFLKLKLEREALARELEEKRKPERKRFESSGEEPAVRNPAES